MIVSNTTPIIHLGKQGKLHLLHDCFGKTRIPEEVYKEFKTRPNAVEYIAFNASINNNWIVVVQVQKNIPDWNSLGTGERAAIMLALQENAILLTDDNKARVVAKSLGVECHGTLYVLFKAIKNKKLTKKEAKTLFKNIVKAGFYISAELYELSLEHIDKFT